MVQTYFTPSVTAAAGNSLLTHPHAPCSPCAPTCVCSHHPSFPGTGIIGVAFVPLAELAKGVPVEGAFRLINPVTRMEAGQIVLGMGWHNTLRLPGEPPASSESRLTASVSADPPTAHQPGRWLPPSITWII